MTEPIPRIAVTAGEPSGIGPDIVIALADKSWPAELVVVADPALLAQRAAALGKHVTTVQYEPGHDPEPAEPGRLLVVPQSLAVASAPGQLNAANAGYVLDTLKRACDGCLDGEFAALVTAPVNKAIINEAGSAFSGHTEFLAERTGSTQPVMLLVSGTLRVALVTTHLSLRDVPDAVTAPRLRRVLETLDAGLRKNFGLADPRIVVLGLNPHAGESGHLGREEIDIIAPTVRDLSAGGMTLSGPLPADTAFTPPQLERADAILAMYHDQGLPVLKSHGFHNAVNVTLGLPIIRTSVDHGTAPDLAGTGRADTGSLEAAINLAIDMATRG